MEPKRRHNLRERKKYLPDIQIRGCGRTGRQPRL